MSTEEPVIPRDESTQDTIVFVNDISETEEKSPTFEEISKQDLSNEDNNNNIVYTNEIASPLQTEFSIKQSIFADTQQCDDKFRYNDAVYLGE